MFIRVKVIGEKFECGIDGFRAPNHPSHNQDGAPFHPRNLQPESNRHCADRRHQMNPRVLLRSRQPNQPVPRVGKTAQPLRQPRTAGPGLALIHIVTKAQPGQGLVVARCGSRGSLFLLGCRSRLLVLLAVTFRSLAMCIAVTRIDSINSRNRRHLRLSDKRMTLTRTKSESEGSDR